MKVGKVNYMLNVVFLIILAFVIATDDILQNIYYGIFLLILVINEWFYLIYKKINKND